MKKGMAMYDDSVTKKELIIRTMTMMMTAVLISTACLTGPDNDSPPGPPWINTDSAYKVIENLQHAYISMDLELYMSCFRDDFEFHLLDITWPQTDSFWGYETELMFHQNMFSYVSLIELEMHGDVQIPWSGDSTGESWQLTRSFDLRVYPPGSQTEGYRAIGDAIFICRTDSAGQWYVWLWWDLSQT